MTSSESSDLKYTGSLELKDGMIHLVHDQALPPHYGGYHPRTNTVFYGGTLEMADPLTLRMSQRDIRIQDGERVEVVSKVAEQCDAWHTLIEHDDAFIREIQALMTEQRVINPDTLGMIGTEAARQYVPSDTTQRPPRHPGASPAGRGGGPAQPAPQRLETAGRRQHHRQGRRRAVLPGRRPAPARRARARRHCAGPGPHGSAG